MVTPQGQQVRESKKEKGETISLIKGEAQKRCGAYPASYSSYSSKRGEESGSPPKKAFGLPPTLHSIAARRG
jgi:hypothetical protein